MNRDTLILAVLLGLSVAGVIVLAALGQPIPELLAYVATGLTGGLTGASLPAKKRPQDNPRGVH